MSCQHADPTRCACNPPAEGVPPPTTPTKRPRSMRSAGTYVGISGVTTREQYDEIARLTPKDMLVAVGVLMSRKTLEGGECNARSPAPATIPAIWGEDERLLRLVHYYARDLSGLEDQLARAMEAAGPRCDGMQVNIAWPPPRVLEQFRAQHPRARLVLQIGPHALGGEVTRPKAISIALRVTEYLGIIDDVLLDVSGGAGRPMDRVEVFELLEPLVTLLERNHQLQNVGIAGGLGEPGSVAALRPLFRIFGPLSLDAESKLRVADVLSLERVPPYLAEAQEVRAR